MMCVDSLDSVSNIVDYVLGRESVYAGRLEIRKVIQMTMKPGKDCH